jgi:hypothetical protein
MMHRPHHDEFEGNVCRVGKIHREAAHVEVASELLAKQRLNIGFVVNNKNEQAHLSAPQSDYVSSSVNSGPRCYRCPEMGTDADIGYRSLGDDCPPFSLALPVAKLAAEHRALTWVILSVHKGSTLRARP